MRNGFYAKNSANYPRLGTDTFFADYDNKYRYEGFVHDRFVLIEDMQLLKPDAWKRYVQQFREDADFDRGWRGEFWGKQMRGACFVYSYTKNRELFDILTESVREIITCADENGRISSYGKHHEFDGWDIWGRKYVLLGMQYYLEICEDDTLYEQVVQCMCAQLDYIMSKIGDKEDGKLPITKATRHWRGLNSSSLLEPVVRLYTMTGAQKYFDFAKYIVDIGGTSVANIFDLAYKNELYPYQYPITKAYELTSCFEGLLEFYRITKEEKYKIALINYADRVLESDFTVIGTAGCTHELLDHSTVRQANTGGDGVKQETCVTVTLMKFFYQMTLLTGDPKYVNAFELSFYNAYLGSVNTEKVAKFKKVEGHDDEWNIEPLAFDSYSPLTAGIRGIEVGGFKLLSDKHYTGCCATIGAAGIGLVPKMQLLATRQGFAYNLYINGTVESVTPCGNKVKFITQTDYPVSGKVHIKLELEQPETFKILVRNPDWSAETKLLVNGKEEKVNEGYIALEREWANGDSISLEFEMCVRAIYPIPYGQEILMNQIVWGENYIVAQMDKEDPIAKNHIALRRGPVTLAQDSRIGYDIEKPISVLVGENNIVSATDAKEGDVAFDSILKMRVPLESGETITVIDYASSGKLWSEKSKTAVWMLTK